MGGGILGASEDRSDLRLTAAGASVVQLESFPPYFRRGEQSVREEGRSNTGHRAQFPGEMVVVRGQEGMPVKPSPLPAPLQPVTEVDLPAVAATHIGHESQPLGVGARPSDQNRPGMPPPCSGGLADSAPVETGGLQAKGGKAKGKGLGQTFAQVAKAALKPVGVESPSKQTKITDAFPP